MTAAAPLPVALRDRPFAVVEALRLGVARDRLERRDLRRPHPGVRVPAHLPDDVRVRAAAALLALPAGSALAGRWAVELLQLPHPLGARPLLAGAVSAVVPPVGTTRPAVRGIDAHHRTVAGRVLRRDGLLVVHPRHLWIDLSPALGRTDAVALGDAVRRRWASAASMEAALAERAGERGVATARTVLGLVRDHVDSAMETRSRLLFTSRGLPEPVCGHRVVVRGEWLAQLDLAWVGVRVAAEFDGDVHRTDRRQWQADLRRRRLLEEAGWVVVVFTADDLLRRPDDLVATVVRLLVERGLRW